MKKRESDFDDGRTIADMSGIEDRSMTGFLLNSLRKNKGTADEDAPEDFKTDNKTRRAYALGALGAGLLIGLVYIVAFAILIVIMLLIFGVL